MAIEGSPYVPELVVELSDRIDNLAALMRETGPDPRAHTSAPTLDAIEQLRHDIKALRTDQDDRQALLDRIKSLEEQHAATTANYQRLRNRKAVRLALRIADVGARRLRFLRRLRSPSPPLSRSHRTQSEIAHMLRRSRPAAEPSEGPQVSIIVPSRDGAHHLRRLIEGLERRTSYRTFELIVVDNGSTDETAELVANSTSFTTKTISNDSNRTFSASCNQGAAQANGEVLLFLNNDTDPINPGWLGAMVDALYEDHQRVAVGALLVYPQGRHTRAPGQAPLTIQHRGIGFRWVDDAPRPANLGTGETPDAEHLIETREVAAATAACLLVDRPAFDAVGGFTDRYVYGWEDVDLCMKLRHEGGTIAVAGGATLFHYEFGTQEGLGADRRRVNYLNNSRVFIEQWTPQLRRLYHRDLLERQGIWAAEGTGRIAITVTDLDEEAGFGDWYTAHELGDSLAEHGWEIRYIERKAEAWHDDPRSDIVVALLPQFDPRRMPSGTITVAWVRNWVERWLANDGFESFHTVLASTDVFAARIEADTLHDPAIVPLATNPDRFQPADPDITLRCDYAASANAWGAPRPLIDMLEVRPEEEFKLFGKGWDHFGRGRRYWRGHLEYGQLPTLYSSTKLVLDDTVEPNVPAVNSRVFDALAAGVLVLSDNPHGSNEWFDGLLPSYTSRSELRQLLDRYLNDEPARQELANRLRELVLDRHTYAQRADRLLAEIDRNIDAPTIGIRISPPTRQEAPGWGDTHFADDLAKALRAKGARVEIALRDEWDANRHQAIDVALHLRGLFPYSIKPGHINMMWIISHPADVEIDECERYDVVAAAGAKLAADLSAKLDTPVAFLPQATNPHRFSPGESDPRFASKMLFVGNSRGQRRPMVEWAIESGIEVALYGSGWESSAAEPHVRAELLDNYQVPAAYRSAEVVLNDHWPDMAEQGIVSNRILDALACGAVVVTDDADGIEELVGDAVKVVDGQPSLIEAIEEIAHQRAEYAERARRAADQIRRDHTFEARADTIVSTLAPLVQGWGGILGGAPDWSRIIEPVDDD